jgi:hypothetical protein
MSYAINTTNERVAYLVLGERKNSINCVHASGGAITGNGLNLRDFFFLGVSSLEERVCSHFIYHRL